MPSFIAERFKSSGLKFWCFTLSMISSTAWAASESSPSPSTIDSGTRTLLNAFPGLKLAASAEGLRAFYGVPMTEAGDPATAVQWWIDDHGDAFGVQSGDLQLLRSHRVGLDGRFTLFHYQQIMSDLPVEGSSLKLLVLNGSPSSVVYAAGRIAIAPEMGIAEIEIGADAALMQIQSTETFEHLDEWTAPELVVLPDVDIGEERSVIRAWKFRGTHNNPTNFDSQTFFVDASNGELVRVRSEVHYADVTGNVSGWATPGLLPDVDYNPPVVTVMPDLLITAGSEIAYTDTAGDYLVPDLNPGLITVGADLIGHWVSVVNNNGPTLSLDQVVNVPAEADFLFAESQAEFDVSQINAHIHTTVTHDFYKARQPDFTGIDSVITANVNQVSSCNAFFSGSTINFFNAADDCPNTAYTTVISHEYGHYIVDRHFLAQGSFGEGYADSVALFIYDSPITGADFFGPGTYVRNTELANQQYPCFDPIHTCGQVLSGVWYDLKLNFEATYGKDAGLEAARQLFTDWSEITDGGDGNDAAHPQTAVEVLIADDDDGYVGNGTPNRLDICDAFAKHNIDCPELDAIAFLYPNGLPEFLNVGAPTTIRVDVIGVEDVPVSDSGKLYYRTTFNGAFLETDLSLTGDHSYEAVIPAVECPTRVEYYFSALAAGTGIHFDPDSAPEEFYSAVAAISSETVLALDFESDPGWTTSGDATAGHWNRGIPLGNGDRGDPAIDFDGSGQCFLTNNADGDTDVDGGTTILTSATYDLSLLTDPYVTYARWYSNNFGADPENDVFTVEVSDDGGANWVELEVVGPDGVEVRGDWYVKTFRIADFVSASDAFLIRFAASDLNAGSVVEAGIDAFKIFDYVCPSEGCDGDVNGDGGVDPLDSGYALARLGCSVGTGDADCDAADANLDGLVDPLDVGYVLSRLGTCN